MVWHFFVFQRSWHAKQYHKKYLIMYFKGITVIFRLALVNLEQRLNNDSRACNQMLLSLIGTMNKGLDIKIKYDLLVIFFAIITALLLEGTIYVVFNYLALTHQEIFSISQEQYFEVEKIKANAKSEMNRDNIKYKLFKNRVKNQVQNIKDNVLNFKKKNDVG